MKTLFGILPVTLTMLLRIAVFCSLCLVVISCASKNIAVVENFSCSGNLDEVDEKIYYPVSTIQLEFAVKNGDTITLTELICLDSVLFTQAFSEIEVHEMCIDMRVQGNTYFSTYVNKYGGFEAVKVIKSVDNCLKPTEEKIKLKTGKMRTLQKEFFNAEIVFFHEFRLY